MTQDLHQLALDQACEHAIILIDRKAHIVEWKGGAARIFGYSADEAVGKHVSILFIPEDIRLGIPVLELEMAEKVGEANDDRFMLRKDGAKFWASGAVSPLRAKDATVGFVKILRNRTDAKMQVEALEKKIEAQEERLRRKDHFIATLAHDLRNPLMAISMGVETIKLTAGDNLDANRCTEMMQKEVVFIQEMIKNVMETAKSASGTVQLNKENVEFGFFIRETVLSCHPTVGVDLQLFVPQGPIDVFLDPTRMRQAICNLLDNAIKHTPAGRISVEVLPDQDEITVKVIDTGRGISPDQLPHIFETFTQAENARGGIGLGLSIVRDVMSLHRGTVQALSDGLGKGSTFIIRFPRS